MDAQHRLQSLYQAFNARDIEATLAGMSAHQVVRDPEGRRLSDSRVVHVYELRDGLVVRMDIEEAK